MIISIKIDEAYLEHFYEYVASMPEGAVIMPYSLDDEIIARVEAYRRGESQSVPFKKGMKALREKIVSER